MTGGALTAFSGISKGVKSAIVGMKTFRGVMISTGIGALVVAVGSLVAYFTQTQKGAEKLEIAMAGLRIVFAKITDVASSFGEKIVSVFNDPKEAVIGLWDTIKTYFIDKFNEVIKSVGLLGSAFVKLFNRDFSGALADATQGAKGLFMELTPLGAAIETVGAIVENVTPVLGELVEEINKAVDAATKLQNRSIQLRKDQRSLALAFAEGRAQIKEYNLIAEDTNQTLEDRLEAAQKAIDIEKGLMAERQRIAQEEVDIQKAKPKWL
jgi:phage-related protein